MIRDSGITQIVVCGVPNQKSSGDSKSHIDFNFNMSTFLHGQQVDFINEDQYRTISLEHLIIEQCYALLEAEDIHMHIQQRNLRLIGASIQPDGYWKTIFIYGFDINQHRLLN